VILKAATAVRVKSMVFWDVMPCSLVDGYQCLDLPLRCKQQVHPKNLHPSTKQQGVNSISARKKLSVTLNQKYGGRVVSNILAVCPYQISGKSMIVYKMYRGSAIAKKTIRIMTGSKGRTSVNLYSKH